MKLIEKYDIALSFFMGVKEVDKIAESNNEEEIIEVCIHSRKIV